MTKLTNIHNLHYFSINGSVTKALFNNFFRKVSKMKPTTHKGANEWFVSIDTCKKGGISS